MGGMTVAAILASLPEIFLFLFPISCHLQQQNLFQNFPLSLQDKGVEIIAKSIKKTIA